MKDATGNYPHASPTPPATATDDPGRDLIAQIISVLPSQVRALAGEAPAWQVPRECLSIAALAHLAAALGNSQTVILPGIQRPAPFSLVMVADHNPGPARWMHLAGEPWLVAAQEWEDRHARIGSKATAAELRRAREELKPAYVQKDFAEGTLNLAQRLNKPMCKVASACPRRMAQALQSSCDRAVVSTNGGIDPAIDLRNAPARDASEMASMLASSWQGLPFHAGRTYHSPSSLTLLWQTTRENLRPLLFGATRPWSETPPPVLFLRQQERPVWLPNRETSAFTGWARLLKSFFQIRCARSTSSLWQLPAEAWPLLRAFAAEVMECGDQHPTEQRFFLWLPDLVAPLALVLTLAKAMAIDEERKEGAPAPIALVAVQGAIVITRWMMKRQIETVTWIRQGEVSVSPHVSMAEDTDSADTEAVSESILNILERKGPLTRRELSRSAHEMNAELRDAALRSLTRSGKVRKNGDETVELAVAESLC